MAKYRPPGSSLVRDGENRKQCGVCDRWLDEDMFHAHHATKDGLAGHCKDCAKRMMRVSHLRRKYGLTESEFQARLSAQGGRCAICRGSNPGGAGAWHVDHDHSCCPPNRACGKCIRGLLCRNCNSALGMLRDSPELLREAASYLERHAQV